MKRLTVVRKQWAEPVEKGAEIGRGETQTNTWRTATLDILDLKEIVGLRSLLIEAAGKSSDFTVGKPARHRTAGCNCLHRLAIVTSQL